MLLKTVLIHETVAQQHVLKIIRDIAVRNQNRFYENHFTNCIIYNATGSCDTIKTDQFTHNFQELKDRAAPTSVRAWRKYNLTVTRKIWTSS